MEDQRLLSSGSSMWDSYKRASSEASLNYNNSPRYGGNGHQGAMNSPYGEDVSDFEADDPDFMASTNSQLLFSHDGLSGITQSATVTWEDVHVTCPAERKKSCFGFRSTEIPAKPILRKVSGIARQGNVLAVMGASGSGKTMLLNALIRRNLGDLEVSGKIRVNGSQRHDGVRNIAAYAQQQDAFVGLLKVKEHLNFHAQLRLPSTFSQEAKDERVLYVLKELGLSHRADTQIGIPGRIKTLSGGERKRLSFATELLTNPTVMLCDEPTTGLDAFMAQGVIKTLRLLAAGGRTVICTIHQPASEVFDMFDQVLLLSDGRTAFMGATQDAITFFRTCGYPCPMSYNPADFFIETLALVPGKQEQHDKTVAAVCSGYEKSAFFDDIQMEIDTLIEQAESGKVAMDVRETVKAETTLWTQLFLLTQRSWISAIRNKKVIIATVLQNIILQMQNIIMVYNYCYFQKTGAGNGVFLDMLYWQIPINQQAVQNVTGVIFGSSLLLAYTTMFAVYTLIPPERLVYRRELENRMYIPALYYLGHMFAEFLPFSLQGVLFTAVIYWPIGLDPNVDSVLICIITFIFITLYGSACGRMMSVAIEESNTALGVLTILRNLGTTLSGPFIIISSIPLLLKPFALLSSILYSTEILTVTQWRHVDFIYCPIENTTNTRCLRNGDEVIKSLSYSEDRLGFDFAALVGIYVILEVLGVFFITYKSRKIR